MLAVRTTVDRSNNSGALICPVCMKPTHVHSCGYSSYRVLSQLARTFMSEAVCGVDTKSRKFFNWNICSLVAVVCYVERRKNNGIQPPTHNRSSGSAFGMSILHGHHKDHWIASGRRASSLLVWFFSSFFAIYQAWYVFYVNILPTHFLSNRLITGKLLLYRKE